jgi:fructokinase
MFIDILANSLATMVNVYDPDAIVFGGGLSQVDEIYQQLPEQLNKYILSSISMPLLLKPKFGDASGVRGAAMLPLFGK